MPKCRAATNERENGASETLLAKLMAKVTFLHKQRIRKIFLILWLRKYNFEFSKFIFKICEFSIITIFENGSFDYQADISFNN